MTLGETSNLQQQIDALKSQMSALAEGGKLRQTGAGADRVGVPQIHDHGGVGNGGSISRNFLLFTFPVGDLAAVVAFPRPSYRLLDNIVRPTGVFGATQRFTATAGTAGSGADVDIVLEASTDRSAWTVVATIVLDGSVEVDTTSFVSNWHWKPSGGSAEYLRVRCSVMSAGTPPKDVYATFDWD